MTFLRVIADEEGRVHGPTRAVDVPDLIVEPHSCKQACSCSTKEQGQGRLHVLHSPQMDMISKPREGTLDSSHSSPFSCCLSTGCGLFQAQKIYCGLNGPIVLCGLNEECIVHSPES
jgi:hypothetical protein